MKSLQEVLEGIEAFKRDMEELGVDVEVAVAGDPGKMPREDKVTLLGVVKLQLEEDPEGTGGEG